MIKRIVKLTFRPECVTPFLVLFEESKDLIKSTYGCHHLELWQSVDESYVFFTYSYWTSVDALNAYRRSPLFAGIWPRTKALFKENPEAWSVFVKSI